MAIYAGALVGKVHALEKAAGVAKDSLKASELKLAELAFANDDLKA